MINFEKVEEIKQKINSLNDVFEAKNEEFENIKNSLGKINDFSHDEATIEKNKKLKQLEKVITNLKTLFQNHNNLCSSIESLSEEEKISGEFDEILNEEINDVFEETNKLFLLTLLSKKYDNLNAIVSFHSGAGGTESYDFVSILQRMVTRFSNNLGHKIVVLDLNPDENGFKSLSLKICGENAYGIFKALKGVHRLVRISPFDSNKRRHTTFASIEVLPEIEFDDEVEIDEKDLKIDTFRASGAGGQHVNKTDSAIRITHIPSGIVVCCQNERSQLQNKNQALKILKSKLIMIKQEQHLSKLSDISGKNLKIEWGNQIVSYVFCPYTMVKDHRTNFETSNVESILDGDLFDLVFAYLLHTKNCEV